MSDVLISDLFYSKCLQSHSVSILGWHVFFVAVVWCFHQQPEMLLQHSTFIIRQA
jgi:hypothetical protein